MGSSITINMSMSTVSALASGNYKLYLFQAVQASPRDDGYAMLWVSDNEFADTSTYIWDNDSFIANASSSGNTFGSEIPGIDTLSESLNAGQTLEVKSSSKGAVVNGGTAGAYTIVNETSNDFTCGLQPQDQLTGSGICTLPLQAQGTVVIKPTNQLLMIISKTTVDSGVPITQAPDAGIFVNADTTSEVTYDVNNGWSGTSVQNVSKGEGVTSLLIQELSS